MACFLFSFDDGFLRPVLTSLSLRLVLVGHCEIAIPKVSLSACGTKPGFDVRSPLFYAPHDPLQSPQSLWGYLGLE